MDHIPLPLHPIRERFKVPLLSNRDYRNPGDFLQYPEQQGWIPRPHWRWKQLFQNPPAEFQAFLQRWLCFGVLDAALDCEINVHDFAQQESDGEYYFSTSRLVDVTSQSFRATRMTQFLDTIFLVANTASSELGSYSRFIEHQNDNEVQSLGEVIRKGQMPMVLDPRVAIGMITVAEFLLGFGTSHLYNHVLRSELSNGQMPQSNFHDPHGPSTGYSMFAWTLRSTIWRLLREDGWCPYQLSLMFSRFNMSGLLFMLHVQRPEPLKEHNVIHIRRLHNAKRQKIQGSQELCASYRCGHRVLQQSTYTTKHCSECHGCRNVSPDIAQLCEILMNGSFPLIMSIGEREDPEKICLVPWDEDVSYIAISHVWSDGLGNVQGNSLPLCQLRRLSKMVRELSGKASNVVLFWLDTVCVPRFNGPNSHEQKAIKTKALAEMRKTYEFSTATLVLDSWLLSVVGKGMSEAEILMRVFSCSWNSRLWTYQEGALPSSVYFHFEDIAFDVDALVGELKGSMDSSMEHTLGQRLVRQHNSLRGFREQRGQKWLQLFYIAGAMSYRTTTVATDEAICLSTLLGLDTAEISNTEPDQRMQKFWRMLQEVPKGIIDAPGPKLDTPGLSWAPRSLLLTKHCISSRTGQIVNLEGNPFEFDGVFKVNKYGLVMKSRAMIIHCGHLRFPETFHFKDQHGFWYHIQSGFDEEIQTVRHYTKDLKSIEPSRFYGGRKIAFLFNDLQSQRPTRIMSDLGEPGTLIVPRERREGLKLGKKVGSARLFRLNSTQHASDLRALEEIYPFSYSAYSKDPPMAIDEKFQGENILRLTMAKKVEVETDWCLI